VTGAFVLERRDRPDEALDVVERALVMRSWYRPAVQSRAHLLAHLGRDREALELLVEAVDRLESGALAAQLAILQRELGLHADARRSLERHAELSPLLDDQGRRWLDARRADAAYEAGDLDGARVAAERVDAPFYLQFADRLAGPEPPRRVRLDVGFVRQHHMTCAPATLAALAAYWGRPVDHGAVAAAICYDGTPDHRERHWAEQNGFVAREFRVTWESATALIDRGVPFTLTTVEPTSAHLQAVIGYDSARGTLLVREPSMRYATEFIAEAMLEHHRPTGPRGMTVVPAEEAHRLDGLELPEATSYDRLHSVQRALERHDRPAAATAQAALEAIDPDHRLAWIGRRAVAFYDADPVALIACHDALLRLFPESPIYELAKLGWLRDLSRRDERLALLSAVCDRPGSDPVFFRQLAQELTGDAREHRRAARLLRRAIRIRPFDDHAYAILAGIRWDQGRRDEAWELYRFAAALSDRDERHALVLFRAARRLGCINEALELLRRRVDRLESLSSQPARTLYQALEQLDRMSDALAVLDRALERHPDDGELLLFAAGVRGELGAFDAAERLVEAARGRVPPADWLRAAAGQAAGRRDLPAALALWERVLATEPLAIDALRMAARFRAETRGTADARTFLAEVAERFPHHYGLQQLRVEWLRPAGPEAVEVVLRDLIASHPADAWARRELASTLADQGRLDEAFVELDVARVLDPENTFHFSVLGSVLVRAGRPAEAREAFRQAIRRWVDNEYAVAHLVGSCDEPAARREALEFVAAELDRQPVFGDGLLAFHAHARGASEPEALLGILQAGLRHRADLWHAWVAVVRQFVAMQRLDEADALAREATERFPLLPRVWIARADVGLARNDREGEMRAIEEALAVSPDWGHAVRRLAASYEREGRWADAAAVLERAATRSPLDAVTRAHLADALWHLDRKDEAAARLAQAVRLDPGYEWAWNTLGEWLDSLGRPGELVELARELTRTHAGLPRVWLELARRLQGDAPEVLEERLAALDRGVTLDPEETEFYDLKAAILARAGRYDEAIAACRPPALNPPPCNLRGRAAWIEAQRPNMERAIESMRDIVAENPDYTWGWRQLIGWHRSRDEHGSRLEAAEALARIDPDDPGAVLERARALVAAGRRADAKAAYRRFQDLDSEFVAAVMERFDLHLEDGELDSAAEALAWIEVRDSGEFYTARAVQYAARRGDHASALSGLALIARTDSEQAWPIGAAVEAVRQAGWARRAERVLEDAIDSRTAHSRIPEHWLGLRRRSDHCRIVRRVGDQLRRGRHAVALAGNLAGALGHPALRAAAEFLVHHYEPEILKYGDHDLWGNVGYALTASGSFPMSATWHAEWRTRLPHRDWILANAALAFHAFGMHGEGWEASRAALALPESPIASGHVLLLALAERLAGERGQWVARLATLAPRDKPPFRWLAAIEQALAVVHDAGPARRSAAFREARLILAGAASHEQPGPPRGAPCRFYRLAVRRLARDTGGFAARAWAALRWIWPPRRLWLP
jgi:tetratricopeptide (TPR) repeat protein